MQQQQASQPNAYYNQVVGGFTFFRSSLKDFYRNDDTLLVLIPGSGTVKSENRYTQVNPSEGKSWQECEYHAAWWLAYSEKKKMETSDA